MIAAGITVDLEDKSGDILATTVTNNQGEYSFNQLSGPAADQENSSGVSGTGDYNIVVILPAGSTQATQTSRTISISRGGQNMSNVNFFVGSSDDGDEPHGGCGWSSLGWFDNLNGWDECGSLPD